ncbi:MAG: hypothetical protein OXC10_03650, partial [Rhodospirillaceae bacterium]|nr:hypothetical protein [Rhodospirillaceae bacterium]
MKCHDLSCLSVSGRIPGFDASPSLGFLCEIPGEGFVGSGSGIFRQLWVSIRVFDPALPGRASAYFADFG